MFTVNKKVAVTPFPTTSTQVTVSRGLVEMRQKKELAALTVVYDCWDTGSGFSFDTGDTVYVPGELCAHQLAKAVFELEPGKPFILVPADMVVGVERAVRQGEEKAVAVQLLDPEKLS
jgi:hypothetical protein